MSNEELFDRLVDHLYAASSGRDDWDDAIETHSY